MTTLTLNDEQLFSLAGLLAGCASADGDFDVFEADEIGEILSEISSDEEIPLKVSRLISAFEPERFSEAEACAALGLETQAEKDAVLALVMRVAHADSVADAQENQYIVRIAELFGCRFEELELDDIIEIVPPPVPTS